MEMDGGPPLRGCQVYRPQKSAENVETILRACLDRHVNFVTLYAFSTENWNRPVFEVKVLIKLFQYYLNKKLTELHKENVKVSVIGDVSPFSKIIKQYIDNLVKLTENNSGMHLNIALNYGGRAEIVRATKRIISQVIEKSCAL